MEGCLQNKGLTDIKPFKIHRTFKGTYRIYEFDNRYQCGHFSTDTKPLNCKLNATLAEDICNASVLTKIIISVNSDHSKIFDIVLWILIARGV